MDLLQIPVYTTVQPHLGFLGKGGPCFWPFKSIILHPKMRLLLHNLYNKWCLGSTVKKSYTFKVMVKAVCLEIFVFFLRSVTFLIRKSFILVYIQSFKNPQCSSYMLQVIKVRFFLCIFYILATQLAEKDRFCIYRFTLLAFIDLSWPLCVTTFFAEVLEQPNEKHGPCNKVLCLELINFFYFQ